MKDPLRLLLILIVAVLSRQSPADAHFLWLVRGANQSDAELSLYFSELAEPDDPDLLSRVANVRVWEVVPGGKSRELKLKKGPESVSVPLSRDSAESIFLLTHDMGVIERGGETFSLQYYAKTGPELGHAAWNTFDSSKQLTLDVTPELDGARVRVTVRWQGAPIAGAQVVAHGPAMDDFEAVSDEKGSVAFRLGAHDGEGIYSIRARYIEPKGGTRDGKEFAATRHYSTLALTIPRRTLSSESPFPAGSSPTLPPIPETVTSFGAAVLDGHLYTYGGHTGGAHSYSAEAQANTLRRLNLNDPRAWESLGRGPGLQGLAMVAHGGKLYRIGGFTAKNREGEEHDLWSLAEVSCYDPAAGKWSDLPPLPEPRSSFDAAVLGDAIYAVGGWRLAGPDKTTWHTTAAVLDLSAAAPRWKAIPEPPFRRRALSVAAHDGKIFAIGGMQEEGGPTTRVDVFDPVAGSWSQGPSLHGVGMDGFGSAAFATGGRLYVSTYSGSLQRLAGTGDAWEPVKQLARARFFHRMLPMSDTTLIMVGGANMESGKFAEVDVIEVR